MFFFCIIEERLAISPSGTDSSYTGNEGYDLDLQFRISCMVFFPNSQKYASLYNNRQNLGQAVAKFYKVMKKDLTNSANLSKATQLARLIAKNWASPSYPNYCKNKHKFHFSLLSKRLSFFQRLITICFIQFVN